MKVAILSDIHGNAIALKTVLNKAASAGVEQLLVLGDLVGYYYQPATVMEMLSDWSTCILQGNHEAMLFKALSDAQYKKWVRQTYGHGIDIAIDELSEAFVTMLINAPVQKNITIDNCNFFLCHGAPWDSDEYIYPDAGNLVLDRCAQAVADFVFMGHTHYPFMSFRNATLLVNAGSVGQARDIGGYACWAIVDTTNRTVVQYRTKYNVQKIEATAKRIDPDKPFLCDVLKRNR